MSCWVLFIFVWFIITENVTPDSCGRRSALPMPLISRGEQSHLGQWPWHIASVHRMNFTEEKYACGGTIISASHILTAAHCTYPETRERSLKPSEILILAGISNLRQLEKYSMQQMEVAEIITHKDYRVATSESDIALLKLDGKINVTYYVKPICLWSDHQDVELIFGKIGYTPGWGRNENAELPDKLHHAAMAVVSRDKCKDSDPDHYPRYLFDRKAFCAGFRNGTSPAAGDSGGGLYLEINKRWMLRGIVSHGKFNYGTGQLDSTEFIVYSDVAQFIPWINNMTSDGECGRRIALPPLLTKNHESHSRLGEWPWHVAVTYYSEQNAELIYNCGGTIISNNYILTSAYGIKNQNTHEILKPSQLRIRAGITNLRRKEHSLQIIRVAKIITLEEFIFFQKNDMALLKLVKQLTFTDYVKPVCLWRDREDEKLIVDKEAYIAGWGSNERNELSDQLNHTRISIISRKKCKNSNPDFSVNLFFGHHHFCGGFHNRTLAIIGYTGGGLYIEIDGIWFLRGISSLRMQNMDRDVHVFNVDNHLTFTSVPYFLSWIDEKIQIELSQNTESNATDACGHRKVSKTSLPVNNTSLSRLGEWPWHAAVVLRKFTQYICGGTIIAGSYILTTANCMYLPGQAHPLTNAKIIIRTGILNLQQLNPSLQGMKVAEIIIHENFLVALDGENDIALLKLDEDLMFSENVKPICLWRDREDEELIVDKLGFLANWDLESHFSEELNHAGMLIVSRNKCRDSNHGFYSRFLHFKNAFCAGLHNGTLFSRGISGGGLYIEYKGRWILRGIASGGMIDWETRLFDTSRYVVFTDVAFFLPWIEENTELVPIV